MARMQATFAALVRLFLVVGLACLPLSQPMALAALTTAPEQAELAVSACPHHAQGGQAEAGKAGSCCAAQGSSCHCAMALALPTAILPMLTQAISDHPVSVPRLAAGRIAIPDTPPPRT